MKYRKMTSAELEATLHLKVKAQTIKAGLEEIALSIGTAYKIAPPHFTMDQLTKAATKIALAIDQSREDANFDQHGPWQTYFGCLITAAALEGLIDIASKSLDDGQLSTTEE